MGVNVVFSWTNVFGAHFCCEGGSLGERAAGFWGLKIEAARSAAAGCMARPTFRNWSFHAASAYGARAIRPFLSFRYRNDPVRPGFSINRRNGPLVNDRDWTDRRAG